MKIGLHIADFTYPSGRRGLADDLTRVAATAEEQGFARARQRDRPRLADRRHRAGRARGAARTRPSATSRRARRRWSCSRG